MRDLRPPPDREAARAGAAAASPGPVEGDVALDNFQFASGESLPELRIHYRTLGQPQRDEHGKVRNAVLILHGTGGSGAQFLEPTLQVSCSARASRSMSAAISWCCPMASGTASRPSPATARVRTFRALATATWSPRSTGC